MTPDPSWLREACPGVDGRLVEEHLSRLDGRYFARFSPEEVAAHLRALDRLSPENPVELLTVSHADGSFECTVLAFDYPAEFSLIAGVFASLGFEVLSGDVFTYSRAEGPAAARVFRRRRLGFASGEDLVARRRIIDRFSGKLEDTDTPEAFAAEARARLKLVLGLLEKGDAASREQARQRVNEMVAASLSERHVGESAALLPVRIETGEADGGLTRLKVAAQDTPFFLYALSVALALRDISIERVTIRTFGDRIEDEFEIADPSGRGITDPGQLAQVRLSVLLTKQFTYFLGAAPDPYAALSRFEQIVASILDTPGQGGWTDLLANPRVMQGLARLLGASDFLWEDFIRLQYENLLPMLGAEVGGRRFGGDAESLARRLDAALEGAGTLEEKADRLNEFKDREIFLIDLDHILASGSDFADLSRRLTRLAELVVSRAAGIACESLAERYGKPRTVAGMETPFAVLGLGKFGGEALGYASDIELLFVYSDSGRTDGPEPIENAEFFERLARRAAWLVRAKREGIFQVDLRLRPYGKAGPWACSLESFCRYYGRGGDAHSYERLALVRLRAVGGDKRLGARVERLRDEIVYGERSIDLAELRDLREKQLAEKTEPGKLNAKFSPGALVDLEYAVQILQVTWGGRLPALKTPSIHKALDGLADAGVIEREEAESLVEAYHFLRRLINGLRMLRGSAQDLFLPEPMSDEYAHLARRMGYERRDNLSPAQQLHVEFETRTAVVRAFVERRFGRASLPGPAVGNVADLVLSDALPDGLKESVLRAAGFEDASRAYVNLRSLAGKGGQLETFARLAVLACDILAHMPDPDRALNNWERFARVLNGTERHFARLLSQPMRLEILLGIFAGSQFLADTLARNPEFMEWVTAPERLRALRSREEMEAELDGGGEDWREHLRRMRRRELLRIGAGDICLNVPLRETVLELSRLAEASVRIALAHVCRERGDEGVLERFCVLAFGKLGGEELNYSSDIDLVGVYDAAGLGKGAEDLAERCAGAMERLRAALSDHTVEGHAYRVDLRLRPYGRSGPLVVSLAAWERYYAEAAALWEVQALLKARPVAGSSRVGGDALTRVRPVLLRPRDKAEVARSVARMRRKAMRRLPPGRGRDVKTGKGGIRDIEFLVQAAQLAHASEGGAPLLGNTLDAINALAQSGILPRGTADRLAQDYVFLRRVEHSLQIFEDLQTHALPDDPKELRALARRMMGAEAETGDFVRALEECLERVGGMMENEG